jgi:uncharacterized protein DUF4249
MIEVVAHIFKKTGFPKDTQIPEEIRKIRTSENRWQLHLLSMAAIICLFGTFSCKKDLYQGKSMDNELVVLAEITAGETLMVPVSKSLQVGNGGIITFEKVKSAIVTVSREDGRTFTLNLNNSPDYASNPASVYTSSQRPKNNTVYNLKVQDPLSGTATAKTTIPGRVHVSKFDTSGDFRSGIPVLKCRFTLTDPPDTSNLYVFEALKQLVRLQHMFSYKGKSYDYDTPAGKTLYEKVKNDPGVKLRLDTVPTNTYERLGIFTDDNNVDNAQVSSLDSSFRRIFLSGHVFNGRPYTETIYVDRKYFRATGSDDIGRVLIQIKSASVELYNYLFWYEKYKYDVGSLPPGQLYSPPGNIQNGLGIFGGSSKHERIFYFDRL